MIKLKQYILQSTQGPAEINKEQFIKLFKQNCKNIHNKWDYVYRGSNNTNQFIY